MRDGLSIYLKENVDDNSESWRSVVAFAHPETQIMTREQQMDWLRAHPVLHDDTYLNSLVQWMEKWLIQK